MSAPKPMLSIRDAKKSYGKVPALRGIDLDLFAGELLGFLGPNGAGKTTLIRCLSGRSRLDEGSIQFGSSAAHGWGVVPQSLAIYEDLTAEQNLKVFAKLNGVPRVQLRARVAEALDWANLTDRRHQLAGTFSGGMMRRLNIACSILHRPKIVLLDEPTVGVDPQSRERIYDMLDELRASGTAILLTTHQLDEAQFRCDRIAIVDQGKVVSVGTFDELVRMTVGSDQWLRVHFRHRPQSVPVKLHLDEQGKIGTCQLENVATELPQVMQGLQYDTESVDHVVLQRPTLQDVFLHLTGKELRE